MNSPPFGRNCAPVIPVIEICERNTSPGLRSKPDGFSLHETALAAWERIRRNPRTVHQTMPLSRRSRRVLIALILYMTFCTVGGIYLADGTLHPARRPLTET